MDYLFMNDLLSRSDEELREISDRIAEQLETRKKLKRKKVFDAFMEALETMAREYPYEVFDIGDSDGEYVTLDWEDLYRSFLNQ